jgi:hypothetical protein
MVRNNKQNNIKTQYTQNIKQNIQNKIKEWYKNHKTIRTPQKSVDIKQVAIQQRNNKKPYHTVRHIHTTQLQEHYKTHILPKIFTALHFASHHFT